jgi:hypothetical protein
VHDLRKYDTSLLCKWWWKLYKQYGMWQKIMRAKYLWNKTIANITPGVNILPIGRLYWKLRKLMKGGMWNYILVM